MTFTTVDALHGYVERLNQLQAVIGQDDMAQYANHLQKFFNEILWPLVVDFELTKNQSQWRAAITEAHRHMRLLTVEVSFVRSARNSQTRQQRIVQIEQRLNQLQGFTQALINLCE
ncbi:MAG: heterocyst frequency control protein PatD [Cyanobacteria bacterium P01_H01_bin.21]